VSFFARMSLLGAVVLGLGGASFMGLESPALADDGAVPLVSDSSDDIYPDWSPDGNWVAFESDRSGNYDIWIVPATGGTPIQVTSDTAYDARACWSPGSDEIVFESDRDLGSLLTAYPVCEIYTIPVTGEPATRITYSSGYDERPDWSPGGSQIAFSSDRGVGSALLASDGESPLHPADLFLIPVTGEPAVQITFDPGYENNANWSPDGSMIAFEADYSGNWDIWVMPAGGGIPTQITTDPADDLQPDWSPDGCDIAFYSYRSGSADIWVIPATGGTAAQVTTHPSGDWAPSWSPDGTQIVFCTGRGTVSRDIYVIDVDRAGVAPPQHTTWGRIKGIFR
jgi:Tol biopolymer transport system component